MNHLKNQQSPYLLQHAENPVDWYPWGNEAFEKAKREDKPVFLSIGYSTCHWCHVMAHESFEDEQVAEKMNQVFVCVKVDREERPDVDAVYMDACQAMNGSGGWPLSVILTPQQKPFFAATYLPKHSRYGQWGMLELTDEIQRLWTEERERIETAGEQLTRWLKDSAADAGTGDIKAGDAEGNAAFCGGDAAFLNRGLLVNAVEELSRRYDSQWGGFGGAPKFPMGHILWFLLRFAQFQGAMKTGRQDDQTSETGPQERDDEAAVRAREMALHTLKQMRCGGMYDHLGGGFSRYSTDEKWLVPHFEKMLYDNALLVIAYVKAWELTGEDSHRRVAEETLNYLQNELRLEGGGFACGQDADSEGEEGKFYVFTEEEIIDVLGEKRGQAFSERYGVTSEGNFEGKNVLNRWNRTGMETGLTDKALYQEDRLAMYEYRKSRYSLHRDDKVLASWNGLTLAAVALAYRGLGLKTYLRTAEELARFLKDDMMDRDGRLFLRWKDGRRGVDGQLSDYAFCAWGMLELYGITWKAEHLATACGLAEKAQMLFADEERGGYFMYSSEGEQLISRPKEIYDGAMPSGNSVMALVLNRLAKLTGRRDWMETAQRQNQWLAQNVHMTECTFGASALLEELYPSWQLICVAAGIEEASQKELTQLSRRLYQEDGNGVILVKTPENELMLAELCPMTVNYPLPERGIRYYYCRDGVCRAPVDDGEELLSMVQHGAM